MPLKLNIGLSRKVGEANYGSRGASINLEVELDSGVLQDAAQLRDRVRDLYQLARQSVDDELHRASNDAAVTPVAGAATNRINGHARHLTHQNGRDANGDSNGHPSRQQNGHGHANGPSERTVEVARASQSQIRAIHAIAKRLGIDLNALIQDRFRIFRLEHLTMREASSLIDDLNSRTGARS